jgi:hypothetical protein
MKGTKKEYPYPSFKNPVQLTFQENLLCQHPQCQHLTHQELTNSTKASLAELSRKITRGELLARRKGKEDKIPALPCFFHQGILPGIIYYSWCFECFSFLKEAKRHYIIKNRHDARFWGLKEKKTLCGACLEKRLVEMPTTKQYLWERYRQRGYWKTN